MKEDLPIINLKVHCIGGFGVVYHHLTYFTVARTRSYTFSNGVVVRRGRRNSIP